MLTEIDVKATLKNKLGENIEDYLILGACNPQFAHQAVKVYRQVGLLMPCNVVVRGDPGSSDTVIVDAVDPRLLVDMAGQPGLRDISDTVAVLLQKVVDALGGDKTSC